MQQVFNLEPGLQLKPEAIKRPNVSALFQGVGTEALVFLLTKTTNRWTKNFQLKTCNSRAISSRCCLDLPDLCEKRQENPQNLIKWLFSTVETYHDRLK